MLLADMGADVLRVDNAVGGPVRSGDMLSRNKRSVALNLKTAGGQRVLHELAAGADVFLEGNRPGVCARLGCDYAALSAVNPRLVYCSLTGYGQTGPMSRAAGHDVNYIALAGVLSQIGNGSDPPLPPLNLVADFGGGGLMAAFGILCALFERERSGRGQYIDAAMIDGAASLMAVHFAQKGARSTPGVGLLGGGAAFYRCYECKCGGYVSVGAIEPQFFAALCEGTGVDVADEQMDEERWPDHIEAFRHAFLTRTRGRVGGGVHRTRRLRVASARPSTRRPGTPTTRSAARFPWDRTARSTSRRRRGWSARRERCASANRGWASTRRRSSPNSAWTPPTSLNWNGRERFSGHERGQRTHGAAGRRRRQAG